MCIGLIQTKFQKEVSPVRASLIFSMEPIFAAAFAFFILQCFLFALFVIYQ